MRLARSRAQPSFPSRARCDLLYLRARRPNRRPRDATESSRSVFVVFVEAEPTERIEQRLLNVRLRGTQNPNTRHRSRGAFNASADMRHHLGRAVFGELA